MGEFGYKIQALAAHVLLGMNHRVTAVNPTGHPDVVTVKGGQEFRLEVEAEVTGVKRTMLTLVGFRGTVEPRGGRSLIGRSCRDVLDRSFDQLVQRAIDGRAL